MTEFTESRELTPTEGYRLTSHSNIDNVTFNPTEAIITISPAHSDLVFQCAVLIIGIIGTAANSFAVFVAVYHNKKINVLMLNQLLFDLFTCVALVITYSIKLCIVQLVGSVGYWLCMLISSELFIWIGIDGSMINLGAIAVERYVKICHPLWHKVHFRSLVVYVAASLIWAFVISLVFATAIPTTNVVDEQCIAVYFWPSAAVELAYGIWYFISFYVILIAIFGACYGQIFRTLRQQQKVFPGMSACCKKPELNQTQLRLLKTTFMLTLSFAIFWLPNQIYYLLMNLQPAGLTINTGLWYGTEFIGLFNICSNPFIYSAKSEPVRNCIHGVLDSSCRGVRNEKSTHNQQQVNTMESTH